MTADDRAQPPRRAVYSALIGRYEKLNEQPWAATSRVPFILFTDDPELRSESWDVRLVTPQFRSDPIRSSRALKALGHSELEDYDELLWIDNTVELRADPDAILADWLSGSDLAVPLHSFRSSVLAEFSAVLELGYDDPGRLHEQLWHYASERAEALELPALWTGMFARRREARITAVMHDWYSHILRYSRRDQLSLQQVLASAGVAVNAVPLDNHASALHVWPVREGRRDATAPERLRALARTLQPPLAQLGPLHSRVLELETILEKMENSRSWRLTRPLRRARKATRRGKPAAE